MQTDIRTIMQVLRDSAAVRGTEGGLQLRRTVERYEEFDTLIAVSEVDVGTALPIPVPLASASQIDWADVVLLLPEDGALKFYFENIAVEPDPGPFEPPGGGITIQAGGVFFIAGGDLRSTPAIDGVILVENTGAEAVRLRGAVGGTVQ